MIYNRFSGNTLDLAGRTTDFHLIIKKNGVEVYRDNSHYTGILAILKEIP